MNTTFPKTFKFGVADADLQVIGEDNTLQYEQSQPTMWRYFATNSGKCYNNDTPASGIDRFHRWKEDVQHIKRIGTKHYRTSISMARLLKRNGDINPLAVKWYSDYFKALQKAGIRIYATLYHWELPQYLNEQGGLTNRKIVEELQKHAKAVYTSLGEYIEEYFLLNEPRCSSLVSYYAGAHAPGRTSLKEALLAAHNLLLAQGLMFTTLKSFDPNLKISTAINVGPRYAQSTDKKDIQAAEYVDGHKNLWFLDPIFLGKYPEFMVDLYGKAMPTISSQDMKTIHIGKKLHALGLNFYRGDIVSYDPTHRLKFKLSIYKKGLTTDLGWGIFLPPHYRTALYDILAQVYYSYKNHGLKKMYITENGMAQKTEFDKKGKIIPDQRRIYFLKEHLKQIQDVIKRGIPLEAYFAWTLMDNYEWAEGYKPESTFGLIYVDRKTMKRTWKESAYWYKKLIKTRALSQE